MKKFSFAFLILSLFCFTSMDAQRGMYIEGSVGYMLGTTNEVLGPDNAFNADYSTKSTSSVLGTFGGGISFNTEVGYMLSDNFGVGLGAAYVLGQKTLLERFETPTSEDLSHGKNTRITLTPTFILDAGNQSFSPYAKFGVHIPVAGQTRGTRASTDPALLSPLLAAAFPGSTHVDATSVINGQFSLGFEAAVGFRYNLTRKLALTAQVGYTGLRIKRKDNTVETATITQADGTQADILSFLGAAGEFQYTVYEKEIIQSEYEAYLIEAGLDYGTTAFPHKALTKDANFSSLNLEIGVRFSLAPDTEDF